MNLLLEWLLTRSSHGRVNGIGKSSGSNEKNMAIFGGCEIVNKTSECRAKSSILFILHSLRIGAQNIDFVDEQNCLILTFGKFKKFP